jgi:hypothetical protein
MQLEIVNCGQPITNINEEALAEWVEYREEKKKPLSPLALKKTQNLLLKYGSAHQQHIVDVAIQNDWVGIHAVPMPKPIITSTRDSTFQADLTDTSWAH